MPTFSTPEPISAAISLVVGDVAVTASDRDDTVVEVHPSDPHREQDVRAAEQTRVEFAAGRLVVKAPRPRVLGVWGKVGSIDITVDLPTDSAVESDASVGGFRSTGRLGNCRLKSATGDIRLDGTGDLIVHTGAGAISVESVGGAADLSTGSGRIEVAHIGGNALVENSNGHNRIGSVAGNLRVKTANGDVVVGSAGGDVDAATANGEVRIGEVTRGVVSLRTGNGAVEAGIREGTAARVDAHTSFGKVHNLLTEASGPSATEERVELRARTSFGDITVRRP
ncbi:DUF4097 family beta strand repeat-containing protein [Prescottella equi]|uniref:DUF4097 family beta strand repeat protein n=1 Tax=Rhodococcus hoagii TaxID=43767 RepID=A0A9Q2XWV3_RHOHA|nr:DUF4097 family beta strand repeat-containing protein [Prescottella equi]MBU4615041.1 DUF4097 family beta strand repeat protein [Rhodococcus sp. GG48]ERN46935.1 hypothetical protein H849_05997 [Prescottella equi NBRC 101255 = C 7]MBM4476224.1 DUF4097 family beta strand repeat protein [Prescottella equi]MBM4480310.1 DUF4097 family beta strand repeat protein [Prescottella equi]MBM4486648.1 DUF4097 family beta strand repeat protein [Prescottella equi]